MTDHGEADADKGEGGEYRHGSDEVGQEKGKAGDDAADGGTKTTGGGQHDVATIFAGHRFSSSNDKADTRDSNAAEENGIKI